MVLQFSAFLKTGWLAEASPLVFLKENDSGLTRASPLNYFFFFSPARLLNFLHFILMAYLFFCHVYSSVLTFDISVTYSVTVAEGETGISTAHFSFFC